MVGAPLPIGSRGGGRHSDNRGGRGDNRAGTGLRCPTCSWASVCATSLELPSLHAHSRPFQMETDQQLKLDRITSCYMTKYERARILGTRALQIRSVLHQMRVPAHCKIPPPHRVGLGALPQHERASDGRHRERDRPACNRDQRTARAENSDDCSKAHSRKISLLSASMQARMHVAANASFAGTYQMEVSRIGQ